MCLLDQSGVAGGGLDPYSVHALFQTLTTSGRKDLDYDFLDVQVHMFIFRNYMSIY